MIKKPTKIIVNYEAWFGKEYYNSVYGFCSDCIVYEDDYGIYSRLNDECIEGHRNFLKKLGVEDEDPPYRERSFFELNILISIMDIKGIPVRPRFMNMCKKLGCYRPVYRFKMCRKHFRKKHRILAFLFQTEDISYWMSGSKKGRSTGIFIP